MGSQSTYLRSSFGGFDGRALAKGDSLPLCARWGDTGLDRLRTALEQVRIYLPGPVAAQARTVVRVMSGRQWDAFTDAARRDFTSMPYTVSAQSDRMGYRLQGPPLAMTAPRQMISEATCFGTVQVPADGNPIVLMADRQTTGGYPKIAQVATVDLPLLAQTAPGQTVRFELISLATAQRLDRDREAAFARLEAALQPLRDIYTSHSA
jgi:biotin-dependent carboxylase-like uncharacterized protein